MAYTLVSSTTSAISFISTSATQQTITTGGKTLGNTTINGAGSSYLFSDNFSCGAATLTLTQGTLNTNGKTVTCSSFSSSNSNTRTLTLGASTLTLSGGWACTTSTNMTLNANTSVITLTSVSTFAGGGLTYNEVDFTTTASSAGTRPQSPQITGANTFATLKRTNSSGYVCLTLAADQTVTIALVLTGSNANTQRLTVNSSTPGTQRTITCNGTITITNVDFEDIVGVGTGDWTSGTSIGDCGNNSGITMTPAVTRYWVQGASAGNFLGGGRWSASSGGAVGASDPLPQDTANFDLNSFSATGKTVQLNTFFIRLPTIDWTGATNSPTFNTNSGTTGRNLFYGSLTLISGMTVSSSPTWQFFGRGSYTLTSAGLTIANAILLDSRTGTLTLQDNLTTSSSLTLTSGTLNANNKNIQVTSFDASNSNTRTLTMGSGTWTLTGTGTVWSLLTSTGLTFNVNTSTIVINDTSSTSKTFAGGGKTYSTVTFSGDNIAITGSNTFSTFNVNTAGLATGLKVTVGTTQTVTTFATNGSLGSLAYISSTTSSRFTLSKGTGTVAVDFMDIADSAATGGATWYAGDSSTDGGNNTGWIFTGPPITRHENINVSENISIIQSNLVVNVFDSVNVSESATPQEVLMSSVFDSVNVSESITAREYFNVSVFDSVTVAEAITIPGGSWLVNVSDSIQVSENLTNGTSRQSSVVDSINISESVSVKIPTLLVSVSDSITVSESETTLLANLPVVVSDNIAISEQVGIHRVRTGWSTNWTPSTNTSTDWNADTTIPTTKWKKTPN